MENNSNMFFKSFDKPRINTKLLSTGYRKPSLLESNDYSSTVIQQWSSTKSIKIGIAPKTTWAPTMLKYANSRNIFKG
jgi:hypothetical protein